MLSCGVFGHRSIFISHVYVCACVEHNCAREHVSVRTCVCFQNRALSTRTKRSVFMVAVLGTLLYGSEAWMTNHEEMKKLESLHSRCLRGVLGITCVQQWDERITSSQVRAWKVRDGGDRGGDVDVTKDEVARFHDKDGWHKTTQTSYFLEDCRRLDRRVRVRKDMALLGRVGDMRRHKCDSVRSRGRREPPREACSLA